LLEQSFNLAGKARENLKNLPNKDGNDLGQIYT
jgi:hypothetical protein